MEVAIESTYAQRIPCGCSFAMPTSSQRLAGFFAFTFLAGLACGYLFQGEDRAPGSSAPRATDPATKREAAPADTTESATREEHSFTQPATDDALKSAIFSAVRTPDYFRRKHDLYEIGMSLDAQGIARALEITLSFPKRCEREWAQPSLIARWLDFDPAAALAWAQALPHGDQRGVVLREFFQSLGLKNPKAAIEQLNAF